MSQSEDMAAIHRYMVQTPIKTKAAAAIRDDWMRWYEQLNWWERTIDGSTYDSARNRRNEFNKANAENTAEKEAAKRAITEGLTTEELAGGLSRRLSTGMYDEPILSTKTQIGLATVATVVAVGYVAKKLLDIKISIA